MKRLLGLLPLFGALVNVGCGDDRECIDIGRVPIGVHIIDAVTRSPICDASVLITDLAGHSVYLIASQDDPRVTCYYVIGNTHGTGFDIDNAGIVGVAVVRAGYRTAMQMVQMVQGECGLIERAVHFELVPE